MVEKEWFLKQFYALLPNPSITKFGIELETHFVSLYNVALDFIWEKIFVEYQKEVLHFSLDIASRFLYLAWRKYKAIGVPNFVKIDTKEEYGF